MTKITDTQYEDHAVKSVTRHKDGWSVTQDNGWGLFVPHKDGVTINIGSTIRVYGRGVGFPFRGVDIDGVEVFYRTEAENDQRRRDENNAQRAKEQADFYAKVAAHDEKYAALPVEFRKRVDRFRDTSPDWRWEFEAYEVFACSEAVKIARRLKTSKAVREFAKLRTWQAQKQRVRTVSRDHSGNTFSAACSLAVLWLDRPKLVPLQHGAQCPLVGCDEYGCYAKRRK